MALTFLCIMLKNGQTNVKNLAVRKYVWPFFNIMYGRVKNFRDFRDLREIGEKFQGKGVFRALSNI